MGKRGTTAARTRSGGGVGGAPRPLAILLLLIGALAVMATSSDDTITSEPTTIVFTLDSETSARAFRIDSSLDGQPDGTIFNFVSYESTSTASEPDEDLGVRFDSDEVGWSARTVTPQLQFSGPIQTIVFSIANPDRNGPVTIALEVSAESQTGGDESAFVVSVTPDESHPIEKPAQARIEYRTDDRGRNFTLEKLSLATAVATLETSIAAELTVQTSDANVDMLTPALIVTDESGDPFDLVPGVAKELALPPNCADGPCQLVLQILRIDPPDQRTRELWQLDLSSSDVDFRWASSRLPTSELRAELKLVAIPLNAIARRTLVVDVSVPPGSDQSPLFHMGFALEVDQIDPSVSSVRASIIDDDGRDVAKTSSQHGGLLSAMAADASLVSVVSGRNVFVLELSRNGRDLEDVEVDGRIAATLHSSTPIEGGSITLSVIDE